MSPDSRLVRPFGYRSLMPHRVGDILFVASPYDFFILEEDGPFSERLLRQYEERDLTSVPSLDHVTTSEAALARLAEKRYDLVVMTPHFSGLTARALAGEIAERFPAVPAAMLAYDHADAETYSQLPRHEGLSQVFLWNGNPALLLALVKAVEDLKNAAHDTREGKVRVILVVEDSPSFYSSYLPIIYSEVFSQVRSLLGERLNDRDRRHRLRARPKILLARNFEEAVAFVESFRDNLLGVISDVRFPKAGLSDPEAGLALIRWLREEMPDLPLMLQSREVEHAEATEELRVAFADKSSPELLALVQGFMRTNFGFGPFVFCLPDGTEVARASSLDEMAEVVETVPAESLFYHAERNHISNWLMARSEFALALEMRPKRATDFSTVEQIRAYLLEVFESFRQQRQRGEIIDFKRQGHRGARDFSRIGVGSMGGKARGIAFLNTLLAEHPIHERFPDLTVSVPRAAVICTDVFERYCDEGDLRQRALEAESDEEVVRLFLEQPLDDELMADLGALLEKMEMPLAVRSSSLHEDSEYEPLAGLYKTFMLPNADPSLTLRVEQLSRAVRLIYASVFFQDARAYLKAKGLRVEEERMAVLVQRLVGRRRGERGERFYPSFAGVAMSRNYYPLRQIRAEDGIATVALGLGQTIVDGHKALRFSPGHPRLLPQMSTPVDALRASQREFYALNLSHPRVLPEVDDDLGLLRRHGLATALEDGTLAPVGATYSADARAIYDTVFRDGEKLVTFAGVLKHGRFPLAAVLQDLLELAKEGLGTDVEMEFAVSLPPEGSDERAEMGVLQVRPLGARAQDTEVDLGAVTAGGQPWLLGPALGNGVISGLEDVVYIHPDRFRLDDTPSLARELARINHRLLRAQRPYILIGPGRWGTADRHLGVPVSWNQVSAARVVVELELEGTSIEPSQGTHFFHNLTSLKIAYFNLDLGDAEQRIDLPWLESLEPVTEAAGGVIRHVALPQETRVHVDSREQRGAAVMEAEP